MSKLPFSDLCRIVQYFLDIVSPESPITSFFLVNLLIIAHTMFFIVLLFNVKMYDHFFGFK